MREKVNKTGTCTSTVVVVACGREASLFLLYLLHILSENMSILRNQVQCTVKIFHRSERGNYKTIRGRNAITAMFFKK